MTLPAVLALADGTIFRGISIGARGNTTGEVVFNTALTGYQEILSDPSYARQIVTLTYPHIGNTGTTPEDLEASQVYPAGLIVRDVPPIPSNWRATESLPEFLHRGKIVAISGIDTRKLTRILRETGAQAGCITAHIELACPESQTLAIRFTAEEVEILLPHEELIRVNRICSSSRIWLSSEHCVCLVAD